MFTNDFAHPIHVAVVKGSNFWKSTSWDMPITVSITGLSMDNSGIMIKKRAASALLMPFFRFAPSVICYIILQEFAEDMSCSAVLVCFK